MDIPEFADKALGNMLDKPSKSVGSIISDLLYITIESRIGFLAEKRRIKYSADLEIYKNSLEESINKIPKDKLMDPDLQKTAAILDASKYCIDKEELRDMFVKLLSATMNKDTDKYVHISFGEILKQLVPDEIKILMKLPEKPRFEPIIDVAVEKPEVQGYFTQYANIGILGYESNCEYPEEFPVYVDNLIRLGIVSVPEGHYLADKWRYDKVLDHEYVKGILHEAEKMGKVYINHKMIGITQLGDAIRKICR